MNITIIARFIHRRYLLSKLSRVAGTDKVVSVRTAPVKETTIPTLQRESTGFLGRVPLQYHAVPLG